MINSEKRRGKCLECLSLQRGGCTTRSSVRGGTPVGRSFLRLWGLKREFIGRMICSRLQVLKTRQPIQNRMLRSNHDLICIRQSTRFAICMLHKSGHVARPLRLQRDLARRQLFDPQHVQTAVYEQPLDFDVSLPSGSLSSIR